jgi:glycerate kinase
VSQNARPHAFLVAPDSFKGTFSASRVAAAIARGLEAAGGEADPCPVADGGEGTAEVLLRAAGGHRVTAPAQDPLGRAIEASFVLLADGRAVVEVAAASGLGLVAEGERDAEAASSAGTGELVVAARAAAAERILVAAGGSATTDGGAGAIAAIEAAGGLGDASLSVLCDVRTRFEEAPRVFGPQKGAGPEAVTRLERRLGELAKRLPRDPRGMEMTGCAGGLSGGLWAAFGAELLPGASAVLDAVGFDQRLGRADACVSGEGRLDSQSLAGKLIGEVARRCRAGARPLHVIAGQVDLDERPIAELGAGSAAEATTLAEIEAAAAALV